MIYMVNLRFTFYEFYKLNINNKNTNLYSTFYILSISDQTKKHKKIDI